MGCEADKSPLYLLITAKNTRKHDEGELFPDILVRFGPQYHRLNLAKRHLERKQIRFLYPCCDIKKFILQKTLNCQLPPNIT